MKTQMWASPGMYVQGYGELKNIGTYAAPLGDSFMVIASTNRIRDLEATIRESFGETAKLTFVASDSACVRSEIERITEIGKKDRSDLIIGMGGGKVIDTAKAVSKELNKKIIIVPTVAASDAATTRCAVEYSEDGEELGEIPLSANPDLVIVDTEIIMKAPKRYLLAGLGDAMAKYVAAKTCYAGYQPSELGAGVTEMAFSVAELSKKIMFENGELAMLAYDNGVMTKDLNKIIELNILISGVACEVNGATTDHSFYAGFTTLKNRPVEMLHGEYVTFSTLATMVLEGASKEELDEYYDFCTRVGLPTTLEDLHLDYMDEDDFRQVGETVLECGPAAHHPFEFTADEAIAAMKVADSIGKMYKAGKRLI